MTLKRLRNGLLFFILISGCIATGPDVQGDDDDSAVDSHEHDTTGTDDAVAALLERVTLIEGEGAQTAEALLEIDAQILEINDQMLTASEVSADLGVRLDDAVTAIENLDDGVTGNFIAITALSNGAITMAGNIVVNAGNIVANGDSLVLVSDAVTLNAGGIAANFTNNFATSQGVVSNSTSITANTSGVVNLTSAIATNTGNIATNTAGVLNADLQIDTWVAPQIVALLGDVGANANAIGALQSRTATTTIVTTPAVIDVGDLCILLEVQLGSPTGNTLLYRGVSASSGELRSSRLVDAYASALWSALSYEPPQNAVCAQSTYGDASGDFDGDDLPTSLDTDQDGTPDYVLLADAESALQWWDVAATTVLQ
jgi:hypothetical protein